MDLRIHTGETLKYKIVFPQFYFYYFIPSKK
jgi:hypothetical protein